MRTAMVIDDRLMRHAMRASGAATKRETVEMALKLLLRLKEQEKIRSAPGKLRWQRDLSADAPQPMIL